MLFAKDFEGGFPFLLNALNTKLDQSWGGSYLRDICDLAYVSKSIVVSNKGDKKRESYQKRE